MNETREDGLTDVFGVAGALAACRQSADTAPFARWVLCRHSATNTSHSIKADESGCSPSVMLLLHGWPSFGSASILPDRAERGLSERRCAPLI